MSRLQGGFRGGRIRAERTAWLVYEQLPRHPGKVEFRGVVCLCQGNESEAVWWCLRGLLERRQGGDRIELGDIPMDVSVMRERAECFAWQVLCIVGIVQWYHPRPRRRGAGVRCPERVACGGPLWVALVL